MTQRHLGDPPEEPKPDEPDEVAAPSRQEPELPPAAPLVAPPLPRGPSDTALRQRQKAWQQERARFEASKQSRAPVDEDSD